MRQPFVHCAELDLAPGADPAAPGGAVTLALCGSWNHEGACRWPHLSHASWKEGRGSLRIVFVAGAAEEAVVRRLIDEALASGRCTGPDGKISRWALATSDAGLLTEEERARATQIALPILKS